MATRNRAHLAFRPKLLVLAVASCFAAGNAWANPTGPTVANGSATFTSSGNTLTIGNRPNTIINWQGFSIRAGETTRFNQSSASSAVLNRVTTLNNPSLINGVLSSNGQVFLINPSGVAIGSSGVIDVAAFVASSLNLSDSDFLSGKLHFTANPGAGAIDNEGTITTGNVGPGGHVYLVGPAVTNGGFITTPQGEAILAAGNSVDLVDPGTPNVAVEIDAPDNQARNIGTIMADAGRVGIFAGLIDQRGTVSADTAMVTDDGKIVFRATQGVNFASNSSTHATGPGGGSIDIDAANVMVSSAVYSNTQTIHASGDVTVASDPGGVADLEAHGAQSIQAGGALKVQDAGPGSQASIFGSGQKIEARNIEVNSNGGNALIINSGGGDQAIRTDGMNAAGEGLAVRSLGGGGLANIEQLASGETQNIEVRNADRVVLDAVDGFAGMGAADGSQNVSITGATTANRLVLGAPGSFGGSRIYDHYGAQSIVVGLAGQDGAIDIYGNTSGGLNRTLINFTADVPDPANTQSVSTSGTLSVYGGSGVFGNNNSGIFATAPGGQQTVVAQAILLQGGADGAPGGGNGAMIGANSGAQTIIAGAGGISLAGGGANAQGLIYQDDPSVTQNVQVSDGGSLSLQGGYGSGAYSAVIAPTQLVNVDGDVTLQGGTVPNSGVRIGGLSSGPALTTDLTLNAGGNVALLGGSGSIAGAALGSTTFGGQAANVAVHAGGDIILAPGSSGANVRIGTSLYGIAGGDIALDAGGRISLQSSDPADVSAIQTLDNVSLHARSISEDAGSLIAANGLSATALDDITIAGTVTSGSQQISAGGDITVRSDPFQVASLVASGQQSIKAGGALWVQDAGAGSQATVEGSGQQIETGSVTITSSGGTASVLNTGPDAQSIRATGGVTLSADSGGAASVQSAAQQSITAGGALALQAAPFSQAYVQGFDQQLEAGSISVLGAGGTAFIQDTSTDAQSLRAAGSLTVAAAPGSYASISSLGAQAIQAGGDLSVQDGGPGSNAFIIGSGQTIDARSVTVASNGGLTQIVNVGSGDQSIRTSGMNAAGEGLAVGSLGGLATIQQAAPGAQQTIDVQNADHVVVDGVAGLASITAFSATQNISITGDTSGNALVLGSPVSSGASIIGDGGGAQSVIAGLPGQNGSIDIYGNTSGGLNRTYISYFTGLPDPGNTQSVSTAGTLTVIGGAGSHGNNNSGVFANAPGGVQRIDAQAIVLQGGGDGSPGGGNGAMIGANAGAQTIDVGAGGITEHGGGANSQALIYQRDAAPSQTIDVGGSILLQGGTGSGGFAGISAPVQLVTVDGDVTLVGGSVPNTGVRIGGFGANNPDLTTNLTLNVGGDVTLLGGNGSVAGEALGGSAAGGQPAKVTVHAGGDITLEPGTAGASARIGTSPLNTAGGDILLDAHGKITLDSAGPGAGTFISTLDDVTLQARSISEGADSSIIARALSASARHGIDLPGTNRVSQFDAATLLSGGITFNNTSPVLDVTGIDAFPFGAVNLTQTGDLLVTGNMLAGRQNIAATGDITVGPAPGAPGVSVFALGPQSITAGGALRLQGGDADNGYVEVGSLGRFSVSTGGDLSLTGGSGQYAHALLWSLGRMDLSVGGAQTLTDGSGQYAWARILRARP